MYKESIEKSVSRLLEGNADEFWGGISKRKDHIFSQHPILAVYGKELSDQSKAHTHEKSKNYRESLYAVYDAILKLERGHRGELEGLAVKLVSELWGIPVHMLDAEIGDPDTGDDNDGGEDDAEDLEPIDPALRKHINKRLTMNTLTQGAAVHQYLQLHHMVAGELNKIDERLVELYSKISAISHIQYWTWEMEQMLASLASSSVGSEKVVFEEGGAPTVEAKGVIFPVLLQELSKGAMELLSYHGLQDMDQKSKERTIKHADKMEYEIGQIQVGPEIWRKLLKVVMSLDNRPSLAKVVQVIAVQSSDDVHDFIDKVISSPEKAKEILASMLDDSSEDNDLS